MGEQRTIPASNFVGTIAVNVNNEKLSDADFRKFIRNTLSIVVYDRCEEIEKTRRSRDDAPLSERRILMKSLNGWILPSGKYVECSFREHVRCAEEKLGMKEQELKKIAIKVSCLPATIRPRGEYCPNFFTERQRMTKRQLETIEKYCVKFGYRPPLDYFFQKDLHNMIDMKTEDILLILGKK